MIYNQIIMSILRGYFVNGNSQKTVCCLVNTMHLYGGYFSQLRLCAWFVMLQKDIYP